MVTVNVPNRLALECAAEEFKCLSTDEKPTTGIRTNALLLELDTGNFYYFNGTSWELVGGQS